MQALRSQNTTLKKGGQHRKYLPYVFSEHGVIMAANLLNSSRAVQMSVFVVRAFIKRRHVFTANEILIGKLRELEQQLTKRLDTHERAIDYVLVELRQLMEPSPVAGQKRRPIGFQREEE
jgi:hypothetical protein